LTHEEGHFFLLSHFEQPAHGMVSYFNLYYFEDGRMHEALGGDKRGPIGVVEPKWEDLFDKSVLENLDSIVLADGFKLYSDCSDDGRTILYAFDEEVAQPELLFEMVDPADYDEAEKKRWKALGMPYLKLARRNSATSGTRQSLFVAQLVIKWDEKLQPFTKNQRRFLLYSRVNAKREPNRVLRRAVKGLVQTERNIVILSIQQIGEFRVDGDAHLIAVKHIIPQV
jgi:hypothetical protein